ncbi:hypothetical protein [Bordetella petrii]|uniref:Membrane protein n=1 Tax=Bordetella petrii (strain ATCC BAA-461 / DSM 12804 / CCUG 43448 / CIP 107267 / Se-1111R) TaxID=340100 RepID=A9IKH4_BORPD|nr:hypothetical protein [Bordetella petrii]CAP42413.1 putative membrane protein [Bordetella petrii]
MMYLARRWRCAATGSGQGGQALPIALALATIGGLGLVALYNVGQTAAARVRLTHAADAAAYSGALQQARALNLLAYINRAQVAHQVAMAHLVTLASWAQFGQAQSGQRTRGNPPAPLIGALFGTALGAAYARAVATGGAVPELAGAFQQHDQAVHQVLQQASASVVSGMHEARRQAMLRVLYANYPEHYPAYDGNPVVQGGPLLLRASADQAASAIQWHAGNSPTHLRGMVELAAARYDFLRPRTLTRRSNWIVHRSCPTLRHELRRRGGTWLDNDGQWGARDTLSYHALRSNRWIGCYYREYAMGWGQGGQRALAGDEFIEKPPQDFSQQDFWRWVHEHTSWNIFSGQDNPMANSYAVAGAARWSSRGLPFYHELDAQAAGQPQGFAIQVSQMADTLSTTDAASHLAAPRGRYAYAGLRAEEAVTVTSAAEAYFAPPASIAGRTEFAGLFRPYWQARLRPVAPGTSFGDLP